VRASARVVAESDGRGGTRLAVLHGESPLLLRRTGARYGTAGATVHLVGGAAGPLRGDELSLAITVGPGADLEIRSVAAQLALPGRAGLPPSCLRITAEVAAGGSLRWLPEPLIAAAGCHHRTVTTVEVAKGGRLLWRDDLVCGRHDEPSGAVTAQTSIRYAGAAVYRHDLAVGPHAPGWSGAAVLGDARAVGTVVDLPGPFPGPGLAATPPTAPHSDLATMPATAPHHDFAMMPLAGTGMLATATGIDIRAVRQALDPLCVRQYAPARETFAPQDAPQTR
jgi:urease accessory protein